MRGWSFSEGDRPCGRISLARSRATPGPAVLPDGRAHQGIIPAMKTITVLLLLNTAMLAYVAYSMPKLPKPQVVPVCMERDTHRLIPLPDQVPRAR
jgi:hypothetical protein